MNARQARSLLELIADLNSLINTPELPPPPPEPNGVVEKPKTKVAS